MFKGGTSLSKGHAIIHRFSEDVDILVTPRTGESIADKERRLREITEGVAEWLGLAWEQVRDPGRGRFPHRADRILYPHGVDPNAEVPEERGVRLETGFAGGEWPTQVVSIAPLIARAFDTDTAALDEYDDLRPFQVRALLPARTLIEKVALLHDVASNFESGATMADRRCGRHYYDIFQLLDRPEVIADLKDRRQFERIVQEMDHVSQAHYGSSTQRPDDGYGSSLAFQPPRDSELRRWLADRYADVELLIAEGQLPTLGQVLKRVEQHRGLL